MEKKMTKKEMYELIATLCADDTSVVDFCNHEIDLLEKKKANGTSKNNSKAEEVQALILSALADKDNITASELAMNPKLASLANEYGVVSTQKLTAGLTALVKSKQITRSEIKGKAYFALGTRKVEE